MATCANCKNEALYIHALNQDVQVVYCATHVPRFLQSAKDAGLLPTLEAFEASRNSVIESLAPVVEDEPAPTPRKKSAKKSVSPEELTEAQAEPVVEEPTVAEDETVEEPAVEAVEEEVAE